MYIIPIQNATVATGLGARIKKKGTLTELHKLMGHRNNAILRAMVKQGNIKWTFTDESDDPCQSCIEAKAKIRSIPKLGKRKTTTVGELIHTDLCGPMRVKSIGGKKYFVTFIDDYSRFLMVYLLALKSEVIDALQMYYAFLNTQFKIKIKAIRSDGGGEYQGRFKDFCKRMGIVQERTLPNSPWQNPVSERMNRTLVEGARAVIFELNLNKNLWSAAILHQCYLQNRIYSKFSDSIPIQLFLGTKEIIYDNLLEFGVSVLYKSPDTKLNSKTREGIYLGVSPDQRGILIRGSKNRIISSQDYWIKPSIKSPRHLHSKTTHFRTTPMKK
jgi:transposase InsO family protein